MVLIAVVLASRLLLGLLVWPDTHRLYNGDSPLYEQYALSMLETGRYLSPGYGSADTNPFADMIRPPGYPLLLAAVYGVVGPAAGPWVLFGLNTLALCGVLALLLGLLRRLKLDRAWPMLLVIALDPAWWMYSKELVPEPWFVLLLTASVLAVYVGVQRAVAGGHPAESFPACSAPVPLCRRRVLTACSVRWPVMSPPASSTDYPSGASSCSADSPSDWPPG